jgi:hypothetical protein
MLGLAVVVDLLVLAGVGSAGREILSSSDGDCSHKLAGATVYVVNIICSNPQSCSSCSTKYFQRQNCSLTVMFSSAINLPIRLHEMRHCRLDLILDGGDELFRQ